MEIAMNGLELKRFVEENPQLASVTDAGDGLSVIKYRRRVFYDNLWNDYLEECRGLVIDQDWNPVVRPFKKVYNYGERGTTLDRDCVVYAERKVNGFMGAATWVSRIGRVVYSTTGSLTSDFARMTERWLAAYTEVFRSMPDVTFLFEICDSTDPHIIPEMEGAYLIGMRQAGSWSAGVRCANSPMLDRYAELMQGVRRPEHKMCQFGTVVAEMRECRHEGYIVYPVDRWETEAGLKIKSQYYLVQKAIARRRDIFSLNRQQVDEEYYPLLDAIRAEGESFTQLDEQARLTWIREYFKG